MVISLRKYLLLYNGFILFAVTGEPITDHSEFVPLFGYDLFHIRFDTVVVLLNLPFHVVASIGTGGVIRNSPT